MIVKGQNPKEPERLRMWLKIGTPLAMRKEIMPKLLVHAIQVPQWIKLFLWKCLELRSIRTNRYLAETWM